MTHPDDNYGMKCKRCKSADPGVPLEMSGLCLYCTLDDVRARALAAESRWEALRGDVEYRASIPDPEEWTARDEDKYILAKMAELEDAK